MPGWVQVFQAQSRIERLGKVQELSGEDVAAAIEGMEPSEREAFLQARQQVLAPPAMSHPQHLALLAC